MKPWRNPYWCWWTDEERRAGRRHGNCSVPQGPQGSRGTGHRRWSEQTDHSNAEIMIIIIIIYIYKVPFFTRVHSVLQLTCVCEVPFFTRVHSVLQLLTPSLLQPVKFLGWKVHPFTPEKSVFDGPITNLLSILCILTEVLWCARAKGEKRLNDFKFGTFIGCHAGKHGSERVNSIYHQHKTHKGHRHTDGFTMSNLKQTETYKKLNRTLCDHTLGQNMTKLTAFSVKNAPMSNYNLNYTLKNYKDNKTGTLFFLCWIYLIVVLNKVPVSFCCCRCFVLFYFKVAGCVLTKHTQTQKLSVFDFMVVGCVFTTHSVFGFW